MATKKSTPSASKGQNPEQIVDSIEEKLSRLERHQRELDQQIEYKRAHIKQLEKMIASLRDLDDQLDA